MDEMINNREIKRFYEDGNSKELIDEIICEYRLKIRLNGKEFLEAVVSNSLLKEFVYGFLFTRGIINKYEDISSIVIEPGIALIEGACFEAKILPFAGVVESTGTRNINLKAENGHNEKISDSFFNISARMIIQKVRTLSNMPVFSRTGGSHCAVLFNMDGEEVISAEDLGRHNSVDKVIGGGLIACVDFKHCWLAVSGRLPSDMVYKAILADIPLIASVSAVTSDGIDTGEAAGMTVVGFTRQGRLNCYCHSERIS